MNDIEHIKLFKICLFNDKDDDTQNDLMVLSTGDNDGDAIAKLFAKPIESIATVISDENKSKKIRDYYTNATAEEIKSIDGYAIVLKKYCAVD